MNDVIKFYDVKVYKCLQMNSSLLKKLPVLFPNVFYTAIVNDMQF